MKSIRAILVVILAVIAVTIFPLGVLTFFATESGLSQVIFHDGNETREFLVGSETVGGFLHEVGIRTNEHDRLSHSPDALLWDGIVITVEREVIYFVQTNGENFERCVVPFGTTISDVHAQLQRDMNIALIYDGDMNALVKNGDIFSFDTWQLVYETEYIPLPYETIRNRTRAVSSGQEHLRVQGVEGEKSITTAVLYIAGIEDHRDHYYTEILSEPVNAILDIGMGWLGSLTDVTAPDFHYFKRLQMEATAYTAGFLCTGKNPGDPGYGVTASGRHVEHGIVAVDRSVIPLGTRLYVENYGFAIAADVGGAIRGDKIDLFMYEREDALRFGRRSVNVWVLDDIS